MPSKISEFTDERIINSIKQSYNFSDEVIKEYAEEALNRDLFDNEDLKTILKENKFKQIEIKVEREKKISNVAKVKMQLRNNKSPLFKDLLLLISLILLIIGVIIYLRTGSIYVMLFGVGAGGVTILKKQKK